MKRVLYILSAFVIFFTGCEYDNYHTPDCFLTGTVLYNGDPVNVRSNGNQLELWQYGFALREKIPVFIEQDGTFSARLFAGEYKLVRVSGAPWEDQPNDSIDVIVPAVTNIEVPVTPYFIITDETFTYDEGVLTSSCIVSKVGTLAIQNLTLYVGTTKFVDANNSVMNKVIPKNQLTNLSTPKIHTITLTDELKARNYIYVRIGVATGGIGERMYTPVQKISLN